MNVQEYILSEVIEVVGDKCNLKTEDLNRDKTFEQLGLDSIDVVEVAMELEERLDLEIPDEIIEKFDTVNKLVDHIKAIKGE